MATRHKVTLNVVFLMFHLFDHSQSFPIASPSTRTTNKDLDYGRHSILPSRQSPRLSPVPKLYSLAAVSSSTKNIENLDVNEINQRLTHQMKLLRQRDQTSMHLRTEDLAIAYEDEHICVVDKPPGILSVPVSHDPQIPSLNKVLFEHLWGKHAPSANDDVSTQQQQQQLSDTAAMMNQMVVHRLGMDTSGLIMFGKTKAAVRELQTMLRTRRVLKHYEALLCGHLISTEKQESSLERSTQNDRTMLDFPLCRDVEYPPFFRVWTPDYQEALQELAHREEQQRKHASEILALHKSLLEPPKLCQTKLEILSRETIIRSISSGGDDDDGVIDLPVTRVTLTPISGRTHQLNVHCAAFGHPIVGDSIYGWGGSANPNGGLELHVNEGDEERQRQWLSAANAMTDIKQSMCVHSTCLQFRHPITKVPVEIKSPAPF